MIIETHVKEIIIICKMSGAENNCYIVIRCIKVYYNLNIKLELEFRISDTDAQVSESKNYVKQ